MELTKTFSQGTYLTVKGINIHTMWTTFILNDNRGARRSNFSKPAAATSKRRRYAARHEAG